VLYGEDDFESIVERLLSDDAWRQRIAKAGHARVQDHCLGNRMPAMLELLAQRGPGRRILGDAEAALGRAEAMMLTWADDEAVLAAAIDACRPAPDDARALNALALASLRGTGSVDATQTLKLLRRAISADPAYVPAARNLAVLLCNSNRPDLAAAADDQTAQRIAAATDIRNLCGPVLPLGFSAPSIDWSMNLQGAVRRSKPRQPA